MHSDADSHTADRRDRHDRDDVTITVLGVKGNQVRVGINAPKQVAVHRQEIYARIKAATYTDIAGAMSETFAQ